MSTPTADEMFVDLLRVAHEDERIRKFLITVSSLDDFERTSLVNSFVMEMTLKGAPGEFIQAIGALRDKELAAKVKSYLDEHTA